MLFCCTFRWANIMTHFDGHLYHYYFKSEDNEKCILPSHLSTITISALRIIKIFCFPFQQTYTLIIEARNYPDYSCDGRCLWQKLFTFPLLMNVISIRFLLFTRALFVWSLA